MAGGKTSGWVAAVVAAGTTLVTAVCGWFAVWSAPVNGDEGYLLVSLREWVVRGGLYDRVYSQYGPFYYSLFGLPSRVLGEPWTIAGGRVTTLVLWVLTALLFGLVVRTVTGSIMFGVAGQILGFSMLAAVNNEPMHPGALLCALLAALAANVVWFRSRAPRTSDALSGLIIAALLLTKVNVGIFAVVAVIFVVGQASPSRRWRWLGSAPLVALGPVLLLTNGQERWRLLWASVYVAHALAVVGASGMHRGAVDRIRFHPRVFAAGFIGSGLLFIGIVMATGTTVAELVQGVLVRPLEHPRLVTIPIRLPAIAWMWILVVPIGVALWSRRPDGRVSQLVIALSGLGRVVGGLTLMISVLGPVFRLPWDPDASRFVMLPLAALVLVPLRSRGERATFLVARRFLAAAAVTESLHAFPVPGSQMTWSVVVAGVLSVVIVSDGIVEFAGLHGWPAPVALTRGIGAVTCLGVVLMVPFGWSGGLRTPGAQFREWRNAYQRQLPISGTESGRLRFPEWQRESIRALAPKLRRECDTAVTLGADLSWYPLAGLRPPTGFNHPAWPSYLNDVEQRKNIVAVADSERACLVLSSIGGTVHDGRVTASGFVARSPLVLYLEQQRWETVAAAGGVQILLADETP